MILLITDDRRPVSPCVRLFCAVDAVVWPACLSFVLTLHFHSPAFAIQALLAVWALTRLRRALFVTGQYRATTSVVLLAVLTLTTVGALLKWTVQNS